MQTQTFRTISAKATTAALQVATVGKDAGYRGRLNAIQAPDTADTLDALLDLVVLAAAGQVEPEAPEDLTDDSLDPANFRSKAELETYLAARRKEVARLCKAHTITPVWQGRDVLPANVVIVAPHPTEYVEHAVKSALERLPVSENQRREIGDHCTLYSTYGGASVEEVASELRRHQVRESLIIIMGMERLVGDSLDNGPACMRLLNELETLLPLGHAVFLVAPEIPRVLAPFMASTIPLTPKADA